MADNRSVVVATLNSYMPGVHDQIWNQRAGWYWMNTHKRVKGVEGGLNILQNLSVGKNPTVAVRKAKEEIPLTEPDFLKAVTYAWVNINGGLPIFKDDERKNRGKAAIIDWAEELISNFTETMRDTVGAEFYASGGDDHLDGLGAICLASVYPSPNSEQQVPGIDRTDPAHTYWRAMSGAQFTDHRGIVRGPYNTAEAWSLTGGADGGWQKGYLDVSNGNEHPDLIITHPDHWAQYDASLLPQERFTNSKLADAGCENLAYKGATVVADDDCVDDAGVKCTYILTTKYIYVRPDTMCENKLIVDGRHPMETVRADRILMEWVGNMTCTRPNRQCCIQNKT